jgi:acetyl-CoA carboxylase/biotin carboxylase 1
MKMYMPLVASEDGIVQFVKQPGVSLEPGDILGILTLDDPARVKHAKPFEGLLPPMGAPGVVGNKPHQRLIRCVDILNDILDGFDNQAIMASTVKDLVDVLHDPDLPYSEVSAILSTLSGRMPQKLEDDIRAAIDTARSKGDGQEFPALRIKKLMEHYVQDYVLPSDRAMFRKTLGALYDALEKFAGGLKGHKIDTVANLLERYSATESLFGGSIEARVLSLREQHKDDLDKVISLVLSHIKAQSKSKLVLALLDYIKSNGLPVSNSESRLFKVLHDLAALEAKYVLRSGCVYYSLIGRVL